MSLWYDIKNKVYSSGPMDNWYITHLKKACEVLTTTVTNIYAQHTEGSSKHHKAEHIEYEDTNLKDALDTERTTRENADKALLVQSQGLVNTERKARTDALALKVDKEDGKALSTNDYTNEEKEAVAVSAGKKVENTVYSDVTFFDDGNVVLCPTSELCRTGSEVFNDYYSNQAKGLYSHAEGQMTSAEGDYSHTEGVLTRANGMCSHAEGEKTYATGNYQHVQGILNIEDKENKYAHIVGNGYYKNDSDYNMYSVRRNAHTIDWQGNGWFSGDVFCGDNKDGLQSQINALYNLRPTVLTEISDTMDVNTIYDLGESQNLSLNLPDGSVGDWIKVDFLSGDTPTELSINTNNICDYSIIPESNTIYSLYFDWGRLTSGTYGWRFSYCEYTKAVTE